jgi:hypothetical protein
MVNEKMEINIGPLSSFNSLNLYIGPHLDKLREDYANGIQTIPVWNLRNISSKKVSIAALVAFLSISKRIRDFIGQPIRVESRWDPDFQGFLADIGFIQIADKFCLYDWQGMLGGYRIKKTNPKTKIFYYSDIPKEFSNHESLIAWKDSKRQEIKHSMVLRLNNVFDSPGLNDNWSANLEAVLTITTAELIVNSLLHGQEYAFVGVQRSSKRVTATVCDTGRGFPKSMNKTYDFAKKPLSHSKALLIASLLSKNKIGLYRAIDDVILSGGYVIMSSFDSEIRWEEKIWKKAKGLLETKGLTNIEINDLGTPIEGFVEANKVFGGYYKKHDSLLIGTRITFEIPI